MISAPFTTAHHNDLLGFKQIAWGNKYTVLCLPFSYTDAIQYKSSIKKSSVTKIIMLICENVLNIFAIVKREFYIQVSPGNNYIRFFFLLNWLC